VASAGSAPRVCVAQIGAAHGVGGEVRLHTFTDDPMAITRYGPLQAEDGMRHFTVAALRPAKGFLVARLSGVGDRTAAEKLRHLRLYVPRERLPALAEEDDFYHADLVGLRVFRADGDEIGSVAAVQNHGAGDLIEVKPISGGPTALIPFTKADVPVVDLEARRLVIDPPEGTIPVRSDPAAVHPHQENKSQGRRRQGGVKPTNTNPATRRSPSPEHAEARLAFPLPEEVKTRAEVKRSSPNKRTRRAYAAKGER
jgi:16S rRNA processing protein RimM